MQQNDADVEEDYAAIEKKLISAGLVKIFLTSPQT